jgi:hypothetical protein
MTREEWLINCVNALRPWFQENGFTIPENVRVTCGWPHKGGLGVKRRTLGECWPKQASADKTYEMFISPSMGGDTALNVAQVVAHEAVHATVGLECGHKGNFRKCAKAIGLEGKMTATVAGEKFVGWFNGAKLPPYPHAKLDMTMRKKQSTRMLKVVCPACREEGTDYIVRMSKKAFEIGAPLCPEHEMSMVLDGE